MKVLQLVLKRKLYDMIASGKKPEEYREIKDLTHVCFHLGYNNQTMLFAIKEIIEDIGKEKWGVEKEKTYYVIKLEKEAKSNETKID